MYQCTFSFQELFQEFATVAFVEFVKGDTEVSAVYCEVLQHKGYRQLMFTPAHQQHCPGYTIPSYVSYIVPILFPGTLSQLHCPHLC